MTLYPFLNLSQLASWPPTIPPIAASDGNTRTLELSLTKGSTTTEGCGYFGFGTDFTAPTEPADVGS